MAADLVSPPYGPFVAGRGVEVPIQVLDDIEDAGEAPKDISDPRWEVHVRAPSSAVLLTFDFTITKSSGVLGYCSSYISFDDDEATPVSLLWEEVIIDTGVADPNTPSQKYERLGRRWRQPVESGT